MSPIVLQWAPVCVGSCLDATGQRGTAQMSARIAAPETEDGTQAAPAWAMGVPVPLVGTGLLSQIHLKIKGRRE